MQGKAYFRNVEETDRELLFAWANDGETRRQSFSTAPITWEEHTAWFARTQADTDCLHWMLMVCGTKVHKSDSGAGTGITPPAGKSGEERGKECGSAADTEGVKPGRESAAQPAGVLRLVKDQDRGAYRISYSIAPAWRGQGLGTELLILAKKWVAAFGTDGTALYGEVRAENAASVRCFEKAGYTRAAACGVKQAADAEGTEGKRQVCFQADIPRECLLYFRADANRHVGYGHVMRCLTIADACEKQGLCPVFVTADKEARETILGRGFPCLVLNTDYRDMESELIKLSERLLKGAPIVLDSYWLTDHYVRTLKENGYRVVWMDDLGERAYPADMLINYNVYAEQLAYPARQETGKDVHFAERSNDGCICLLGPSYAPVRPSFRREEDTVRETIGMVLVTTGGSDPYGAGAWFAKLLTELLPDARIQVVCGPYAEGKETLYRISEQHVNVTVVEGCSDLSALMHQSDLAVAAAGSTLYELCAARLPGLLYYLADNQRRGAETFAHETGAVNLGDLRAEGFAKEACARISEALTCLAASSERKKLADAMHALVDGNGAVRIAKRLAKLVFAREA